jgi:CHAT domain-containing protein/lipopolysaccharide biosynthesis regulator YciM
MKFYKNIIFLIILLLQIDTKALESIPEYLAKGDKFLLYNQFDSAIVAFNKVKLLTENTTDFSNYITALNKLSETYSGYYNPEKAEEFANKALKISDEKFGKTSIEHLISLNNLGNAHYLKGKHQEALNEFNKVIDQYNHLPEEKKFVLASPVIMGLGNVFYSKYQYKDALHYFQQALEINKKYYGEIHPNVASTMISLGNLYRNMGSYSNAQENYDKASSMLIAFFGENHPNVAASFIGKADLYTSQRQFELATQYYLRALSIYENFLRPNDPRFGDIYLGLGDVAKGERDYENSIKNYKKALEIFTNSVGLEHQNTVKANLEIGNSYMYKEEIMEALKYYNKVLEINYMLVGEFHTNTSGAYNNLGGVYYFIGNYDLSLSYYERALAIDKAIYGNDHPNVANSYYNIAKVYSEKGNSEKALEYIQLAINSSIIDFENNDIYASPALLNYFDDKDLMWYLNFKGETLEAGFKVSSNVKGLDVALQSFLLSDSLIDKIRESYTNKKDQAELAKLTTKIYASAVNSAYSLIQLLTPQNVKYIDRDAKYEQKLKEYKEKLFYFSEKSKACMLFSSVAKANAKNFGGVPDSLLKKEVNLKTAISQYTQELYLYADPDVKKQIAAKLVAANRRYEDLLIFFKTQFPKYHELKYDIGIVSVKQLQEYLGDSSMLISYLISKENLFIINITKNQIDIQKQPYNENVEKFVRGLRNGIIRRVDATYLENAYRLYKYLLPFEIPSDISKLIIIPDGPLHFVPFETLLKNEVTVEEPNYSKLPYLVNQYDISYSYSANLLYRIFNNEKILKEKAKQDILALAPVKFEYQYENTMKSFPSLEGTELELKNLTAIFEKEGKKILSYTYTDANESQLIKINPSQYQYLHLATHGFMSEENPEKSGILLYQKDKTEDGVLYAGEIYDINLNAELVVMSACETGLGKTSFGEGLIGLGRSLLYAGAKNLIVSLWTVSDDATNLLMSRFYTYVAPISVPSSKIEFIHYGKMLRYAKLDLLNSSEYNRPYYWAPFILQGR